MFWIWPSTFPTKRTADILSTWGECNVPPGLRAWHPFGIGVQVEWCSHSPPGPALFPLLPTGFFWCSEVHFWSHPSRLVLVVALWFCHARAVSYQHVAGKPPYLHFPDKLDLHFNPFLSGTSIICASLTRRQLLLVSQHLSIR